MPPTYFPLRWESTGDHWWFASPIDWAAANGHYDLVRELLRLDGNHLIKLTSLRRIRRLETLWDDGEQFHDVAKCRSQIARKLLIECEYRKGKSSLIQGGYGGWLLYTAASAGDLEFVKDLLKRDPLLVFGEGEYGVTDILYAAARSKSRDVFRVVFDFAMSPRFSSGNGRGPEEHLEEISPTYKWEMRNRAVHAVARGGNLMILRELLADCSDVLTYRDVRGASILHAAAGRGQVEVVKYLIASFDIVDSTDRYGNTALHVAAYRGQLAVVEALVLASPSLIYNKNIAGETFLHMAVTGFQTPSFQRLDRQTELMKQLVGGKIFNAQEIINSRNNDGRTALHLAIMDNIHSDLVELLMAALSIEINVCDNDGMTPLDILRRRPHTESSEILTRQLISAGGIFSSQDYSARKVLASHLKMQTLGSSPGTSFRISDAEIFLYTGIENVVDAGGSVTVGVYSSELSQHDSSMDSHNPRKSKKLVSLNEAAQRLKSLLHWPKIRRSSTERLKKLIGENSARISEGTPIPLRERFSQPPSLPNNKRTLAARSNVPSPNAKKKLASELMHGSMPQRSSRSSSFPKASFSLRTSLDKQKGILIEKSGASCSNEANEDGQPTSIQKQHSVNKKSMNQYLCFGETERTTNTLPSGLQPYDIYEPSVLSTA